MSKKSKSLRKQLKKFTKGNKVMLAGLGGAVVGIAITKLFGTEKAQQFVATIEERVKEFGSRVLESQRQHEESLAPPKNETVVS